MAETTPPAKKAAAKKTAGAQPGAPAPEASVLEKLAADFPADWIEKLPKTLSARDDNKGLCSETVPQNGKGGPYYSADGYYCGKWHARAVHLDYVGHAGITMRLNAVLGVGGWDFQPMATTPEGLPILSSSVFYGQLTIRVGSEAGGDLEEVTKWDMAANFKSPQEAYGDCLRRCAMRFGVGTYLWSKSDQALERAKAASDVEPPPEPERTNPVPQREAEPTPERTPHAQATFDLLQGLTERERYHFGPWWEREAGAGNLPLRSNVGAITPAQAAWVAEVVTNMRARAEQEAEPSRQESDQQGELEGVGRTDPQ